MQKKRKTMQKKRKNLGSLAIEQSSQSAAHSRRTSMTSAVSDESIPYEQKTTIYLRNVPCSYTQKRLFTELREITHLEFDHLFLTICAKSRKNLGYAFINFLTHKDALEFCNVMDGHKWTHGSSMKVASTEFGKCQGRDNHIYTYRKLCTRIGKFRPWANVEGSENCPYDQGLHQYWQYYSKKQMSSRMAQL
jgi:RNA recognition motif-containing protein